MLALVRPWSPSRGVAAWWVGHGRCICVRLSWRRAWTSRTRVWLAFMIVLFINKVSQDPVYHFYNGSVMSPSMKFSLLLGFVTLMAAPVVVVSTMEAAAASMGAQVV